MLTANSGTTRNIARNTTSSISDPRDPGTKPLIPRYGIWSQAITSSGFTVSILQRYPLASVLLSGTLTRGIVSRYVLGELAALDPSCPVGWRNWQTHRA